jgi:hypothetical protein
MPVDQHSTFPWIIEAREETNKRGLSCSGGSNNRRNLTWSGFKGDILNDGVTRLMRAFAVVPKGYVLERNVAMQLSQMQGTSPLSDFFLRIEHVKNAAPS